MAFRDGPRKLNVLVVDDEPAVGMVVGMQLHEDGMHAEITSTPEEALAAADDRVPDLMILDYHMPRHNGLEVSQRIRAAHGAGIPGILVTGRVHALEQASLDEAGIEAVVTKPFSPKQLAAVARRVLEKRASSGGVGGVAA